MRLIQHFCTFLSKPTVETSPQTKREINGFLWHLSERCLASQRACLRWTSQSVLWCCFIALFTSASCSKPIWSETHRVLTTISTSVNSLLGHSRSAWLLKWFLASAERLYSSVWALREVFVLKYGASSNVAHGWIVQNEQPFWWSLLKTSPCFWIHWCRLTSSE